MKNIENKLTAVKLKNHKEPFLKGKLALGFKNKEMQLSTNNKSNDTFANTDEGNQEFEYLNSESKENLNSESEAEKLNPDSELDINEALSKPKMQSRLSLKSRAYVRSRVPNLVNNKVAPAVSLPYLIIKNLDK